MNQNIYLRARIKAFEAALNYEVALSKKLLDKDDIRHNEMRIAYLRNGHIPQKFFFNPEIKYDYTIEHSLYKFIVNDKIYSFPVFISELEETETTFQDIRDFLSTLEELPLIDLDSILLYHGTASEIYNFYDFSNYQKYQKGDWGKGIYLSRSKSTADYYRIEALKKEDPIYNDLWEKANAEKDGYDLLHEFQKYGKSVTYPNKGSIISVEMFKDIKLYNYVSEGMTDPYLVERAKSEGYDGLLIDKNKYTEEYVLFNSDKFIIRTPHNITSFFTSNRNNPEYKEFTNRIESIIPKKQIISNEPLTALEIHTLDTFFEMNSHKVCGKQKGATGFSFPVETIGTKEDIINAINNTLGSKPQQAPKANLKLIKLKAKALKLKLQLA